MRRQGATRKATTVASIQLNSDGTVHSNSGTTLNGQINPATALSDAAKSNVGITTRTSSFASYNTGAGPVAQGSAAILRALQQSKLALTRPFGWAVGDFFWPSLIRPRGSVR